MSRRRASLGGRFIELGVGVGAGLLLFLLVLWALQAFFPEATGLGDLVRSDRAAVPRRGGAGGGDETARPVAVLTRIRRDVRSKGSGSVVWATARTGARLDDGDAVQSGAASGATITFDADNVLDLDENSLIVVRRHQGRDETRRRRASVLFMEGFLRGRFGTGSDDGVDLEVLTGGGTVRAVTAGNEEVALALDTSDGRSTLAVKEGRAEIVWQGQTTAVPAGFMVTFDPERPPEQPIPLPEAPIPVAPKDGESFAYRDAPPRVVFAWRPAESRDDTRLQIAADSRFESVVYEGLQTGTTFTHGNLPAGEYSWRVTGVRGPIEGAPSAVSRFRVRQDAAPPKLTVEFPEGPVTGESVVVRGATEPGCHVFIGEDSVATDAEGRFHHRVSLRDGYNFLVVQAVDGTGNTAFASGTVVARREGASATP